MNIKLIKLKNPNCKVFGYNNDNPFSVGHPLWLWRYFIKCLPIYYLVFAYRNKNLKDFKKREIVKKFELILLQKKISNILNRQFLEKFQSNTRDIQVKNRCVLTARSKGICSDFRLSRIKTRELGSNGLINGFKKVSW